MEKLAISSEKYCAFVGLQFDDKMLNWGTDHTKTEEKPWDFLPHSWIKDIKETNGFRKNDMVHNVEIDYPQFVHDAISHNLRYYILV